MALTSLRARAHQPPTPSYNHPRPQFWLPPGTSGGPFTFPRPLGFGVATTLTRTSLEGLGFGLVRFGSTKCFRVFQPRPLSGEDGFKAGDNFLVRKIKTEGSNRN